MSINLRPFYLRPTAYDSSEWNVWHGLVCRVLIEPPEAKRYRQRWGPLGAKMLDRSNKMILETYVRNHHLLFRRVHITRDAARSWLTKFPPSRRAETARCVLRVADPNQVKAAAFVKCEAGKPGSKVRIIQGYDKNSLWLQAMAGPYVEVLTKRLHEEHPPGSLVVPCGGLNGEAVGTEVQRAMCFAVTIGLVKAFHGQLLDYTDLGLSDVSAANVYGTMVDYLEMTKAERVKLTPQMRKVVLSPQGRRVAVAISLHPSVWFMELDVEKMDTSVRKTTRDVLAKGYRRAGMPRRAAHALQKLRSIRGRSGRIKYFTPYGNASGSTDTYFLNQVQNGANIEFAADISALSAYTTVLTSGDDGFGIGGADIGLVATNYPRSGMRVTHKVARNLWECTFLGSWFHPSECGFLPTPLLGRCLFKAAMSTNLTACSSDLASRWALSLAVASSHDAVLGGYLRTVAVSGQYEANRYKMLTAGQHPPTTLSEAFHLLRYGICWEPGLHPEVERHILAVDDVLPLSFPESEWERAWFERSPPMCVPAPTITRPEPRVSTLLGWATDAVRSVARAFYF